MKTAGIQAFGAHVPRTRLALGKAERAVCAHDEDAVTMAVAAAVECLRGVDRATIDGVLFASTSSPYREKPAAVVVARALDLRRTVATIDLGGSLRCGLTALGAALDRVAAGSAGRVLVVASDCRPAAPRSPQEASFGDAAAAFLVGTDAARVGTGGDRAAAGPDATADRVAAEAAHPDAAGALLAERLAAHAVADEIHDVWRADGDRVVRSWEERFVVEHGVRANLTEAVTALCRGLARAPADFDRAALYAPDARTHAALATALELPRERVQDPFFGRLGNAGAAFAPLLLGAALESAAPGDTILAAAYGGGAEALALRVAAAPPPPPRGRRTVVAQLEARRPIDHAAYLRARGLDPGAPAPDPGGGVSATRQFRDRDDEISLLARACRRCGALHFPSQRICPRCRARDDFTPVRLGDRRGQVVTYTIDHVHPSPAAPTVAAVVDVEGEGGSCRLYLMLTDLAPTEVRCGLPVELVFRRIHEAGGRPNYYWKGAPWQGPSETR